MANSVLQSTSSSSLSSMAPQLGHSVLRPSLLGPSLALNLALLFLWFFDPLRYPQTKLSPRTSLDPWTATASSEAQLAASYNCSGRGFVYADALFHGENPVSCECEDCFTGPSCEYRVPDCKVYVDSGDPLMFQHYWRENSAPSAVLIPGWYRIGYDLSKPLLPALENEIRAIHRLVGNAVTDGRYIVVGAGETLLAMAAYSAFSLSSQGRPVNVFSAPPYYDAFERQVKTIKPRSATWSLPSSDVDDDAEAIPLEMVISPNNPDGSLRKKILMNKGWTIYDHAYYWPHYVPITGPLDHDFMMFTLSKLTGHAGTRIGWAIVKDFAIYEKMILTVRLNLVKVSHESQLRAAHLLRTVREGYEKSGAFESETNTVIGGAGAVKQHLFHYFHDKLSDRWHKMIQLFQNSDRFLIDQDLQPNYCNFFKKDIKPTPAFTWIRCLRDEDQSCPSIFEEVGVFGRAGARCGMSDKHVRLALLSSDMAFETMLERLETLVSKH